MFKFLKVGIAISFLHVVGLQEPPRNTNQKKRKKYIYIQRNVI